jgi:hypothetical protein
MRALRLISIGIVLFVCALATPAFAQQGSIVGTVTDESKAVLPGVTVTLTDLGKNTQTVAVSDDRGEYRFLRLDPGTYKVQADLAGFGGVVVPKIDLLVGQNMTAPLLMKVASISETLTVSGEAPLVDVTTTQVSGNVNRAQMDQVPLLGRNWLELAKMVPGMTANVMSTTSPGVTANNWAMNLDGQQVANKTSQGLGQPKFSREAIAEYQIVTNLYDVSQGRSTGVQLQAITKSGTNIFAGSAYGYFRDSSLNAPDAVSGTTLPYKDRQYGASIGGPIIKDKMHFFFSVEPESTPGTIFDVVQALGQTFTIPDNISSSALLLRVDNQLTKSDRLSVRMTYSNFEDPANLPSPSSHPSQQSDATQGSFNLLGTWSKVLSPSAVMEVKTGWKHFTFTYVPTVANQASQPNGLVPEYDFPGLTVGPVYWMPQWHAQDFVQARFDLNLHRGSHDLKIGGEFLNARMWDDYWNNARGRFTFTTLPANLGSLIPQGSPYDPTTWNLAGLSSAAQRFNIAIPRTDFTWVTPDPEFAFWIGDNWRPKTNLTITYGVRYDNFWYEASAPGVTANSIQVNQLSLGTPSTYAPSMTPGDFGYKQGVHDNLDIGPQGGFAWNVGGSNDFVIRGGTGLYYTVFEKAITKTQILTSNLFSAQFNNTGNPNFVTNPTGGINTYAQAITTGLPQGGAIVSSSLRSPKTWQSGLGFSKQISAATGISSDLVYRKTIRENATITPNLIYNPATGYNVNPSSGVPNPGWGQFSYATSDGKGDYMALQSQLTQRLSSKLQGGASYTLMFFYHDTAGSANNPFDYINGEFATSTMFQRSTVRAWGTYELPWMFSISGTFSYGSGNRFGDNISTNPYGGSVTNRLNLLTGGGAAPAIVVPAGVLDQWEGAATIASGVVIPKNALDGLPFYRVDLRLTKRFNMGPRLKAELIGELFNVFNHANYTGYNTVLSATAPATTARFGLPTSADIPREGQLGFRFTF